MDFFWEGILYHLVSLLARCVRDVVDFEALEAQKGVPSHCADPKLALGFVKMCHFHKPLAPSTVILDTVWTWGWVLELWRLLKAFWCNSADFDNVAEGDVLGNRFLGTGSAPITGSKKTITGRNQLPLCWAAQVTWTVGHVIHNRLGCRGYRL